FDLRQSRDEGVEHVPRALAVDRRNGKDLAGTEVVELVEVGVARIVNLVRDEHPRLLCVAQQFGDVVIARVDADARVDDEENQIRFADRFIDLTADLDVHWRAWIVGDAAGVKEPEITPGPIGLREVPITRGTGFLGHDGAVVADDAIEERRLADVRPADECDDGDCHVSAVGDRRWAVEDLATCPSPIAHRPSPDSTSMKSYDGCTGIGSSSRTVMNDSSSRKTPLSLMHSAGISARSRSLRPASARRMSAATRRPAVVVVGPKSELVVTMSSKSAPVCSCSAWSSSGMMSDIDTPVTTPMRRPSRRGSSPRPS